MGNKAVCMTEKARALALFESGVPVKQISDVTKLSSSTIYQICRIVRDHGYNPVTNPTFQEEFFKDTP